MATFYKPLSLQNDIVTTKTLLHEAIPITGTIVSGTYKLGNTPTNVKNYTHGMFQSVYDYPYLSSSANHIFDIAVGFSNDSVLSGTSATHTQVAKKINVYNQMSQVLMGYDQTGSILQFDEDGDLLAGGTKQKEVFFLNFSRLLVKDEIKKGSFQLDLGVDPGYYQTVNTTFHRMVTITDFSGSSGYLVNSPVGEYGILYATGSVMDEAGNQEDVLKANKRFAVGLLFYQAGVAVISGSVFNEGGDGGILNGGTGSALLTSQANVGAGSRPSSSFDIMSGTTISDMADAIRNRIYNVQFNNTVELNSTIYYCRANHNEFNYSSNPTYLTGSKIRVKTKTTDIPVSYITTVGLYSDNNELLAVAKLSEPLKKTPDTEFTIRTRLDY